MRRIAQQMRRFFQSGLIAVDKDHAGALFRQTKRGGAANAKTSAGDKGGFSVKS